ncbi:MAG: hypothetical protein Q7V63_02750 [Gammaproteobacteria bacterium]|nr:hypothetical protein [Gammaproteobacteria bacterium]
MKEADRFPPEKSSQRAVSASVRPAKTVRFADDLATKGPTLEDDRPTLDERLSRTINPRNIIHAKVLGFAVLWLLIPAIPMVTEAPEFRLGIMSESEASLGRVVDPDATEEYFCPKRGYIYGKKTHDVLDISGSWMEHIELFDNGPSYESLLNESKLHDDTEVNQTLYALIQTIEPRASIPEINESDYPSARARSPELIDWHTSAHYSPPGRAKTDLPFSFDGFDSDDSDSDSDSDDSDSGPDVKSCSLITGAKEEYTFPSIATTLIYRRASVDTSIASPSQCLGDE